MAEEKSKMGRPRKDFDWELVNALCALRASEEYVAERLLIGQGKPVNKKSVTAMIMMMQRRIRDQYDCTFVEFRAKKDEPWRISLRKLQRQSASEGNPTMLVWLGKNDLGQSDKIENVVKADVNINEKSYSDFLTMVKIEKEEGNGK